MMFTAARFLVGGGFPPPLIPVKVAGERSPMPSHLRCFRGSSWFAPVDRIAGCALVLLLAATTHFPAAILQGQEPAQESQPASANQTQAAPAQPAASPAAAPTPQAPPPAAASNPVLPAKPVPEPEVAPIMEDDLRHLLIGKDLFLRGGYLDNNLEFDEHGTLISHSPKGSYTLCAIRVTHVRLLKHKIELEGERYGLHFLGGLPGDDPTSAYDRVNITPKKKNVRITIDRELVVKEKPQKQPKLERRGKKPAPATKAASPAAKPAEATAKAAPVAEPAANSGPAVGDNMQVTVNLAPDSATPDAANPQPSTDSAQGADHSAAAVHSAPAPAAESNSTATSAPLAEASAPQPNQAPAAAATSASTDTAGGSNAQSATAPAAPNGTEAASQAQPQATPSATQAPSNAASDAEQAQAEIAQAPAAERPADAKSITTTHSQDHANQLLEKAIDNVFSVGLDPRMMAAMPVYWKLYYEQAGDTAPAWPADASILRQNAVDKKARLVSVIDPTSNQYAQDHAVAGMAEYRVVVGADGKPGNIAVARPIGFGLDETAVESLGKATFEPAMKDGHPVPVALDMVVEFRIYSKLTAEAAKPHAVENPDQPVLPGPYSVQH